MNLNHGLQTGSRGRERLKKSGLRQLRMGEAWDGMFLRKAQDFLREGSGLGPENH